jgi:hypothetical protein
MIVRFLLSILFFIFCNLSKANAHDYSTIKGDEYSNPLIDSVKYRFEQIPDGTNSIWAWPENTSKASFDEYISHGSILKSIIRLPGHIGLGQYIALTAIDNKKIINMFILNIGKEYSTGPYKDNLNFSGQPQKESCAVIRQIILGKKNYLNVGGMQTCGKYLAIPLMKKNGTRIRFYDIENPTGPFRLHCSIKRHGTSPLENCSVAFTRLNTGYYLVAVWSDLFGLYFYLSNDIDLEEKHCHFKCIGFIENKAKIFQENNFQFSSINFVQDIQKNIFMIGAHKEDNCKNINIADLFLLKLEKNNTKQFIWVGRKSFTLKETSCFNTGCSVYVHDSKNLWLYSCNPQLTIPSPDLYAKSDHQFISFDQYGVPDGIPIY